MVFSLIRSKAEKKQQMVDTQEAYNLWGILLSKYRVLEKIQLWENFTHDLDLKLILKKYRQEINTNISTLEKLSKKYSVRGPVYQNIIGINTPGNTEAVQDRLMAVDTFTYSQEHIENLLRAVRTSMTNDSVRSILIKMAIKTINETEQVVQYLKLKSWLETPPLYQDTPPVITEKLTTVEAYHLWDHLNFRYDNLRQTYVHISYAYDGDFKLILEMGVEQLSKHTSILEKEMEHFGIPMPRKPAAPTYPPHNTEHLDDDYMFRIILIGIQGASIMHAQALKQCTYNDRIRNMFKKLLLEEIGLQDRFIKFGKIKGWLNPVPAYRA